MGVMFFDTTLRDGEQTPGVSLNAREKVEIATLLSTMGVDVIEAGFPIASPGDFAAVRAVAGAVRGSAVAALARATAADVDTAWQAIVGAEAPRIHTFIAASDIHLEYKLKMTRSQVLEQARAAVSHARRYTSDVEFSAEDASRSDPAFLCELFTAAIEAGATTINIPDTVGYATPGEFGRLVAFIRANVPNIHRAVISVHCHNDLGLAVANTLAAMENGAVQLECAVNGLGERAGNAALEELVMALYTRRDCYRQPYNIKTEYIARVSRKVSALTGVAVQPNKAVVGANAFAHESGIHQHGVINNPLTYEIMSPQVIGLNANSLVLGKHSGKHALAARLAEMGYQPDDETLARVFTKFKALADKKRAVYDEDLAAIADDELCERDLVELKYFHVVSGNAAEPTATMRLAFKDVEYVAAGCGDGPVDAVFKAVNNALGVTCELADFQLKAVTAGEDAQGEATVRLRAAGAQCTGRGISTDIVEAAAKAYIAAVNRLISAEKIVIGGVANAHDGYRKTAGA